MKGIEPRWGHAVVIAAAVWVACTMWVVGISAQTTPSPEPELIKVSGALYTKEQALRGEVVFRRFCLGCHRENLHSGEGDLSLTGPYFLDYWGRVSFGGLVNMIRTTMPSDAPPNTITVPQAVDMVAYILWLNYYPEGTKELPADLATLNRWTLQTADEHLQRFIPKKP